MSAVDSPTSQKLQRMNFPGAPLSIDLPDLAALSLQSTRLPGQVQINVRLEKHTLAVCTSSPLLELVQAALKHGTKGSIVEKNTEFIGRDHEAR